MNPAHVRGRPRDLAPHDEVGTPDENLRECDRHGVIYRDGGQCLVCVREAAAVAGDEGGESA